MRTVFYEFRPKETAQTEKLNVRHDSRRIAQALLPSLLYLLSRMPKEIVDNAGDAGD